jgi:D-threo-aldose 1-dehydrogenase
MTPSSDGVWAFAPSAHCAPPSNVRRVALRHTEITTSAVGFGSASLTSLNDRARATALLETAFDAGITHFDTARLYGFGQAERIVGAFLKPRRDRVTIATKFGLQAPALGRRTAVLIPMAKKLLRRFPGMAARARRYAAQTVQSGRFTAAEARASLEASLRDLRTDYVDVLLLHEATLVDARSEELLRFLDDQVGRGTIRTYGLASNYTQLDGDASRLPVSLRVTQFENDVVTRQSRAIRGLDKRAVITHSAMRPLAEITAAATSRPDVARDFERNTGLDLRRVEHAAPLLLQYAAAENPEGIVVFSARHPNRVRENACCLTTLPSQETMQQFVAVVDQLLAPAVARS